MRHHLKPLAFCAASLALAAGCTHTSGTTMLPDPAVKPAPAAAPAAPAANLNKGTIDEVLQAGRYSYISVDNGSSRKWFAIPSSEVKAGQQVEVQPGMEIKNYNAKSLNRTFDSITFTDGLTIQSRLPANHPPLDAPAAAMEGLSGKVVETLKGSDFTYVCIENGGVKTWLTVPVADTVTVGEELRFLPGKEMMDFNSKKLNRTFDRIIFSGGVDRKK